MRPAEVLLRQQKLAERARQLGAEIGRLEGLLSSNPEAESLGAEIALAAAAQEEVQVKLRAAEAEAQDRRSKMRARERELMSGRIRNPSELISMSEEVKHMKERLREQEEAELGLMEQVDESDQQIRQLAAELEQVRATAADLAPEQSERLGSARQELAETELERDQLWAKLPASYQAAVSRIRVLPAASEVVGGQCAKCRVGVTSSAMQTLRRSEDVVICDNCGRVLVMA